MNKPRVLLRRCDDYAVDAIERILSESVDDLGLKIAGKVFVKPNVVNANKRYNRHSFTNPAVVEAMLRLVRKKNPDDITVGESGGFGIPTRYLFKEAGYYEMTRRQGVRLIDLNEHAVDRVELSKGVCHRDMLLSRYIREADFKIWMPRLKYHIFTDITNALKLNIGILTHKERMICHDHRIHEKIVDMLEVGYPDLVVSDAIETTYGWESAAYPVPLGLLMIANDPLAADVVGAYIMGYRAEEVRHLKIAHERGYGSLSLGDISIEGDADLEELRAKPKGQTRLFQHLKELDTPIRFYAGYAPDTDMICDGGCEAALKATLALVEKKYPGALKKAKKGAVVTGIYHGDVDMPDGPVLFIGTCTRVEGTLNAKKIRRVNGCPMGAKDLMLSVPFLFGLPNPVLDLRDLAPLALNIVQKGMSIVANKVMGR
ncbi:MAG TPA: DUF362 domain-containing protein [Spirochaetota bacterium]|nr:DUF362 domain-containing protein [Spirochaetota bacterium]